MRITPSLGTMFESNTSPDSTSTTLNITITVDHFRNRSFYYSCLLVLAGPNGLPSGEFETSANATIDPLGEWVLLEIVCLHISTKGCSCALTIL